MEKERKYVSADGEKKGQAEHKIATRLYYGTQNILQLLEQRACRGDA
jgi:hypothetical protein